MFEPPFGFPRLTGTRPKETPEFAMLTFQLLGAAFMVLFLMALVSGDKIPTR